MGVRNRRRAKMIRRIKTAKKKKKKKRARLAHSSRWINQIVSSVDSALFECWWKGFWWLRGWNKSPSLLPATLSRLPTRPVYTHYTSKVTSMSPSIKSPRFQFDEFTFCFGRDGTWRPRYLRTRILHCTHTHTHIHTAYSLHFLQSRESRKDWKWGEKRPSRRRPVSRKPIRFPAAYPFPSS